MVTSDDAEASIDWVSRSASRHRCRNQLRSPQSVAATRVEQTLRIVGIRASTVNVGRVVGVRPWSLWVSDHIPTVKERGHRRATGLRLHAGRC